MNGKRCREPTPAGDGQIRAAARTTDQGLGDERSERPFCVAICMLRQGRLLVLIPDIDMASAS